MKRLVILLSIVFLLLDLADDGCLGKAPNFVINHPLPQSYVTLTHHAFQENLEASSEDFLHHWGKGNLQVGLLPAAFLKIPSQAPSRPVAAEVQHTIKIIACCRLGSSGGIPL